MAFDTGISSAVAQYVYTQSQGAVVEPIGGSYIQAYCEYLGITEPVGNSWLIALCNYFGITEPLNGSWSIALANYYNITYPTGGTWWMALSQVGGVDPTPPPFIWGLNTRKFGFESRIWNYVTPVAPTADFTSDTTQPQVGEQVQFLDTSTGLPTSWNWNFTGGIPATSNEQNPLIQYDTAGNFSVSLEAINDVGTNTKTVPDYITAIDDLTWNTTNIDWDLTDVDWATVAAPVIDFQNQSFTDVAFPTLVGTATAGTKVLMTIEGNDYETLVDEFGEWSIALLNQLPQANAPGNDYTASAYVFDAATGLTSATVNATITMITTVVATTITLDMFDSYGDGWNTGWFQLEQETLPGVWTPVEYEENPFRFNTAAQVQAFQASGDMTGAQYYKTDTISGRNSGLYGLRFERYEPYVETAWTTYAISGYKDAIGLRTWNLVPGNYRTVAKIKGSFQSERSYTIRNGAVEIASQPSSNTAWEVDTVQTTFTI
jgi:PKD repeat protein